MDDPIFDPRIFEGFEDGVLVLRGDSLIVSYQNVRHRQLWGSTPFLQSVGQGYRRIDPSIDELIERRSFGHRTLEVPYGSSPRYYYLNMFPVNGHFYVIMSRDITDQFLSNRRDRQYKSLFFKLFNTISLPVALVDATGTINRFNPMFFNQFSTEHTITSGSYIWEHFGDDRPKVKELVEELLSGVASSFECRNCRFVVVEPIKDDRDLCCCSDNCRLPTGWILVFGSLWDGPRIEDAPTEVDPEIDRIVRLTSDFEAFIRVLKWLESLPWRLIIAVVLAAAAVAGGLDLSHLMEGDRQEQGQ